MSLLSKPEILLHQQLGGIVIHPFEPSAVKSASVDARMGNIFYRWRDPVELGDQCFNPYDPAHISSHFEGPFQSQPADELSDYSVGHWRNVDPSDRVIVLRPHEMILGHTEEFIGGTKEQNSGRCFLAEMKARSSIGRIAVEVCRCAGWGDVGFVNRWTMEFVNTAEHDLILVTGTRVCQFKFYEVAEVADEDLYGQSADRDHYQTGIKIEDIIDAWTPEQMLPRVTKD